jgi:hypothetical protein
MSDVTYTDEEKIELFDALMEKQPLEFEDKYDSCIWKHSEANLLHVLENIFESYLKYRPKKEPRRFWLYRDKDQARWYLSYQQSELQWDEVIEVKEVIKDK